MTENENKAIEYMNRYIKEDKEQIEILNRINDDDGEYEEEAKFITERTKKFEVLLNLIEKQQKALQDSIPKEAIIKLYNKYFEDIKIYDRENKKRDNYYYECIKICDVLKEILGE